MENLDPDYLEFVEFGGNLKHFTQEVLDRVHYSTDFFTKLKTLMDEYESPFAYVQEGDEIVRKLKPKFQNQNLKSHVA